MSSCNTLAEATFPCIPSTFVGWTSLAYVLLPLNIAFYDLEQLYLSNCNIFKYHAPFSNSFQTGIYTYILCVLSICHAIGSFICHGCTGSSYTCYIDVVALYCIYLMLSMFSWTRLFCQFKINRYYKVQQSAAQNKQNAKLIHTILFSSKYHWISTIVAILIALSLGIIAILFFGQFNQQFISGCVYSISYVSFFLCEFLIRKMLMIRPLDDGAQNCGSPPSRNFRLSSTGSNTQPQHYFSLGLFEITTENKKAIFALIFIIIAGCGYLIDILDIDKTCENIGHGVYHIFSSIAFTFWYWSLVGEKWTFLKREEILNHLNNAQNTNDDTTTATHDTTQRTLSPNSGSLITNNSSEITDTSLRQHILNSSAGTYSNGHDINDTVLNMDGIQMIGHHQSGTSRSGDSDNLYKHKSGKKRTFLD